MQVRKASNKRWAIRPAHESLQTAGRNSSALMIEVGGIGAVTIDGFDRFHTVQCAITTASPSIHNNRRATVYVTIAAADSTLSPRGYNYK